MTDYRDIDANCQLATSATPGLNQSGDGSPTVTAIDCQAYDTNDPVVQAIVGIGAVTGSPSAVSVAFKIQESDDGSTGWTDCTDTKGDVTLDAAGEVGVVQALRSKRYVRVLPTAAFTGGTSPAADLAGYIVLRKRET